MGRNRRMPPLFEVMRQTNPGSSQPGQAPAAPGPAGPPGAPPSDSARNQPFFRAPGQPQPDTHPHAGAALRLTPAPDAEGAPPPSPSQRPSSASAAPSVPSVPKPVEVRVGQARRNWVVEDTSARAEGEDESSPDPRSSRSGRGPGAKAPLPIPGMWLAVGAAVAVTLIVIVWIVAYRVGSSAKEQEFQGKLSDSAPVAPSTPPLSPAGGAGLTPGAGGVPIEHRPAREPDAAPTAKPQTGPAANPPTAPAPAVPVANDPAPAVDPRRAETNYLSVLTLRSKDDAVELAKYLTAGGLPAATVALKASGGTSTVGWEVFVLQGIASADFRRADDTRNAIHRKLEELGRAWNQEGRSRLNLSRDNVTWRKHKPGS